MSDKIFEEYYHEFKDKVYTHVYYRVGTDKDAAADVTSDIFCVPTKTFLPIKISILLAPGYLLLHAIQSQITIENKKMSGI